MYWQEGLLLALTAGGGEREQTKKVSFKKDAVVLISFVSLFSNAWFYFHWTAQSFFIDQQKI